MSKHLMTFEKKNVPKFKLPSAPEGLTRVREMAPKFHEGGRKSLVLCPYCHPIHPLIPGVPSPCGTGIKITAVQVIYTKRFVEENKLICAKCKQGGGEMVQYMKVYAHIPDCKPDTILLPQLPKFNPWAGVVFRMKEGRLKEGIEFRYGLAQVVKDIDSEGNHTGKVLGYFFMKKPGFGYPVVEAKA